MARLHLSGSFDPLVSAVVGELQQLDQVFTHNRVRTTNLSVDELIRMRSAVFKKINSTQNARTPTGRGSLVVESELYELATLFGILARCHHEFVEQKSQFTEHYLKSRERAIGVLINELHVLVDQAERSQSRLLRKAA